jgi:hypothetical protein
VRPLWTLVQTAILALSIPTIALGQTVPGGPEFQVNTYTTGTQFGPWIASDAAGNFVVVWTDYDNGGRGQRFDSAGTAQGSEFQFHDMGGEHEATVVMDSAGNFVVVWATLYGYCAGSTNDGICARRFDSAGSPVGPELVVTPSRGYNPKVAFGPAGNFVVAWASYDDYNFRPVVARRFDSAGAPTGAEFQVNTYTTFCCGYNGVGEDHQGIEVVADGAGNFMLVWGREYGVAARSIDSAGVLLADEFEITTDESTYNPMVGVAPNGIGEFIVVWDRPGLSGRRVGTSGTLLGSEFQLDQDGDPFDPALAATGDGEFVVVWQDVAYLDGSEAGVFGRQFDSAGTPIGAQFQVNTFTTSTQGYPSVASSTSGSFAVVWVSNYQEVSGEHGWGIFGRRFGDVLTTDLLLSGRKLLIRNAVPDNPLRNKGVWLSKDTDIVIGAPESDDDPRCNGDPDGTVKASIRFVSDGAAGSTQDTGAIDLPCENWLPLPPFLNPSGYKYKDRELDEGPCKRVFIRNGKRLKTACFGKGATTTFDYDLMEGTDEGTVNVVLTTGSIRYCTAFGSYKGRAGTDGKRFQGRDADKPTACP